MPGSADFLPQIEPDDLVIITADHGNDPTFRGTDHTREEVPLLVIQGAAGGPLGTRASFADVAATLAAFFKLPWSPGASFSRAGSSRGFPQRFVRRFRRFPQIKGRIEMRMGKLFDSACSKLRTRSPAGFAHLVGSVADRIAIGTRAGSAGKWLAFRRRPRSLSAD